MPLHTPAAPSCAREALTVGTVRRVLPARSQISRQQIAKLGGNRHASLTPSSGAELTSMVNFGDAGLLAKDAKMDLTAEELMTMRDELSLSGLDFEVLFAKVMKKYRFFTCIVMFQLFACFPVFHHAPPARVEAITNISSLRPLPAHSVWLYLEPEVAYAIDPKLQHRYDELMSAGQGDALETDAPSALPGSCLVPGFARQAAKWKSNATVHESVVAP